MRNYGEQIEIDPEAVRSFYNKRFDPNHPLGSVMMSDDEEMLRKRDARERAQVLSLFKLDQNRTTVLDMGCGNGRWHDTLKDHINAYEGVDFSEPNIEYAIEHRCGKNVRFWVGESDKIAQLPLANAPYNFILSCGLFPYLNDDQIATTLKALPPLLQPATQIYFRTSVSVMEHRLTLKDFPSEALKAEYNAIYRTPGEYEAFFNDILIPEGFSIVSSGLLLTEDTGARKETNQQYWLLIRTGE